MQLPARLQVAATVMQLPARLQVAATVWRRRDGATKLEHAPVAMDRIKAWVMRCSEHISE
jgi:hypothetical protein